MNQHLLVFFLLEADIFHHLWQLEKSIIDKKAQLELSSSQLTESEKKVVCSQSK